MGVCVEGMGKQEAGWMIGPLATGVAASAPRKRAHLHYLYLCLAQVLM